SRTPPSDSQTITCLPAVSIALLLVSKDLPRQSCVLKVLFTPGKATYFKLAHYPEAIMQPAKPRVFQSGPRRITTVWTPGGSEPRPPRYALLPDAVTAWDRARLQPLVRYADACRPTHTTIGVHGGVHRATTAYPVRDVLWSGEEASGAVHQDCGRVTTDAERDGAV